jgi:hypothetical protein
VSSAVCAARRCQLSVGVASCDAVMRVTLLSLPYMRGALTHSFLCHTHVTRVSYITHVRFHHRLSKRAPDRAAGGFV